MAIDPELMTESPNALSRARSSSLIFFALWLTLVTLELGFNLVIPQSALHNRQLPLGARFGLVSYAIVVLSGFLVGVAGLLRVLAWAGGRILPSGSITDRLLAALPVPIVWLILLLYAASWALFWQTGKFLSREALLFIWPHALQIFHWVDADVALGVVLSTLLGAAVPAYVVPWWVSSWKAMTRRRVITGSAIAFTVFAVGAIVGELYSMWGERQYRRSAAIYAASRDYALGPLARVLGDIRAPEAPSEKPVTDPTLRITSRSIISMDAYLAGVDPSRTNTWNVILLIVESLRADHLKIYGATRDVMPAVDALARESRIFLNAYTQASHSDYATIVPFSSQYPLRSATIYHYPKNPTYPRVLIYDILKALGYRTAIFSSSNMYWGGMIYYFRTGSLDHFLHAGTFSGPTYVRESDTGFAAWVKGTKHAGSIDDRFTMDETIKWIGNPNAEPFFVALNFQSSHVPYTVPKDFPRRFSAPKIDLTVRFGGFPKNKVAAVKDLYADSLAYIDSQISRLIQYLRRRGLWDRTVIVVTGDHGQAFYEHGFAAHASEIFNEVMKVPLVIRAPELRPSVDDRPAQHVDIAPSILALLGLPPHPGFQGVSLLSTHPEPGRAIYMVTQTPLAHQYGIIRFPFKLIYDEWKRQYLLYDLASDPEERANIARRRPMVVQQLAKRLHAWREMQINYYGDQELHTHQYPPVLAD